MKTHLSSKAISQWIVGERSKAHAEHLRECEECSAELARVEHLFFTLGTSVRHWSDRRIEVGIVGGTTPVRRPSVMRWASAVTLMVAVGLTLYRYADQRPSADPQRDALLEQVDAATSRSIPEAMEPLTMLLPPEAERSKR
jgi:hypothetical protein